MAPRPLIVAIDGPAGAGKSSVSRLLAQRLDFVLVDTGAIYRCVALKAQRDAVAFDDDAKLGALLKQLRVTFKVEGEVNRVFLDGEDVSEAIRAPQISLAASQVSGRKVVRDGLLDLQRRLALGAERGAILEGRDIGTVVFPDADVKVFLSADPAIRAQRRFDELSQKGVETPLDQVLSEQIQRDREDTERDVAPLKPADDAVTLDSTRFDLPEVVRRIEDLVHARAATRG